MKRILGLDLGTTSIGWAFIEEAENDNETSSIIKTGVRVVPLSTDEQNDFKKGQSITINADRTLKRGARRNLHRYKLRRKEVINILKSIGFIDENSPLTETEVNSTHQTYELRAKAPLKKLTKEEFARVLLMINKKRGYKSSRKANNQEEGQLIDGMAIAKKLNNENLTPGQLSYQLLHNDSKLLPDYYRSDLEMEFERIWEFQKQFYPEFLTSDHKDALKGLNKRDTGQYFEKTIGTERAENKGSGRKVQHYEWRNKAVSEKLKLPEVAYILTEINNEIFQSSGYLGAISDRSKELYFNDLTVGQYLFKQLKENPHTSLKNQVFYRQDYLDEFDAIWEEQSKHYPELTEDIKDKLRNKTIFYQRPLKSQKGLISICEFEGKERNVVIDGETKRKVIGPRVIPRSSPLFQQFRIWQIINNIVVSHKSKGSDLYILDEETKKALFDELNLVEKMTDKAFLKWLFEDSNKKASDYKINFNHLEGNKTQAALFACYNTILELEEYETINLKNHPASHAVREMQTSFNDLGIDPTILEFNATLSGNDFAKQSSYELWHLLYSYEDDNSPTGVDSLIQKLQEKFGFKEAHARLLINISLQKDYGSLSARAIRKIFPYLEDGFIFSKACEMAGYNHSHSVSKKDLKNWTPKDLEVLKKNSLRNPVVEKILNQMINVVNAIIDHPELERPDEIRVELARDLKQTADQRNEATRRIAKATRDHEELRTLIKKQFGLPYVSRRDLIKYKLYRELKATGYKTLYSGTYIKPEELFSNKFDVEHIIPQALLFDDSFSNKTLELRSVNLEKGDETSVDYCDRKGWLDDFKSRIQEVYSARDIGFMKRKKLLMTASEIPEDFLNRDLGISAYIARQAVQLLRSVSRTIVPTTGQITAKLREDWGLINVLQELNWNKYETLGLTYFETNKHGKKLPRIQDWTKRNDHRHHAMDAITVAFTRPAFIQYLNNMSAQSKDGIIIQNIKEKYTYRDKDGGRKFHKPFENIREEAKKHLESILVSHKAKNKVVTRNKNKIKRKGKNNFHIKTELTPRGQLHKETVYGRSQKYATKLERVGSAFDVEKINTVGKKNYREALLNRLVKFEGNPRKAFTGKNSLLKNPILLNDNGASVPDRVQTVTLQDRFTIRKEIAPDLRVDKVVDVGVRRVLQKRLDEFGGNAKEAFSNLDDNPIWLNEEKQIQLKRVTITGVRNAEPLSYAKDHHGNKILDEKGNTIPVDFVSTGNNHHVAIYKDEKGNLQEEVVSFFEAVTRVNLGLPIIKKEHELGWEFQFSMKQNEMFVFPSENFNPAEIDLSDPKNAKLISENLYRVQKLGSLLSGFWFRHHLETSISNNKELKNITYIVIQSSNNLKGIHKVRLNHLGKIVQIGEY
ncbi:MAG TPA: type II CRISPR RNA-guided endonuclease Cas9 [Brumimicrobium sp.]|nr:type II CRISPR RNA-guided endonuclease Cas9 [Brumimicrobium sp.]